MAIQFMMSDTEAAVEASPRGEDAPYIEPENQAVDHAAEDEPSNSKKPKSASSPVKKIARPAKPRSSVPSKGKRPDGELKAFKAGDIVLSRLKGYPAWRESTVSNSRPPR